MESPDVGMGLIHQHLRLVCGHSNAQYQRLIEWLANAVQNPAERSGLVFCISGPPGCGKGLLWKLICRLFGTSVCCQTSTRDVWGSNNARDAVFVNICEAAPHTFMGDLKSIVTDPVMRVRTRNYQPAADISIRARFIINTNQPVADVTGRIVDLDCSADMVGNQAYFVELITAINDDEVIGAMHNWLKHWSKSPWARLGKKMRVRAIVLYWLGLTEPRMAPGGPAEARDRAAFAAEF